MAAFLLGFGVLWGGPWREKLEVELVKMNLISRDFAAPRRKRKRKNERSFTTEPQIFSTESQSFSTETQYFSTARRSAPCQENDYNSVTLTT